MTMELSQTIWLEVYRAADRKTRKLLLELNRFVSDVVKNGCTVCTIDCDAALAGAAVPDLSGLTRVCVECTAFQAGVFLEGPLSCQFAADDAVTLSADRLACWHDFRSTCQIKGAKGVHFLITHQNLVSLAVGLLNRCYDLQQVGFNNIGTGGELYIPRFWNSTAVDVRLVGFSCGFMGVPSARLLLVQGHVRKVRVYPSLLLQHLYLHMHTVASFPGNWQHLVRLQLSVVEPSKLDVVTMPALRFLNLTRVDVDVPNLCFKLPSVRRISLDHCRLLRQTPAGFMFQCRRHPTLSSFSILLTSFSPQEAEDWSRLPSSHIKVEPDLLSFRLDL